MVTCVSVNPALDQFWLIDDRIYDPEGDGKTNLEHVEDMLINAVHHKHLPCESVLMETWDATKHLMLAIEALHQCSYCPLKDHRQVDDSTGKLPYRRVDSLAWSPQEQRHGKIVNIKGFPNAHQVNVFRVVLSSQRTDDVVTNNLAQDSTAAVEETSGWRWKIEPFHREAKQLTGLEGCQCRKARMIRNHIGCAMLVWVRLKHVAHHLHQTSYQVKKGVLSDYLRQQLQSPTIKMVLA